MSNKFGSLAHFYFLIGKEIVYSPVPVFSMQKIKAFILAIVFLIGCSGPPPEKPDLFEFSSGKKLAELKNDTIEEVSGLAASINNKGFLWTHNDSGNDASIFLIDENLNIKLTCKLVGAENRDWEDITIGPGPDSSKTYIYVGDIGDNLARYDTKIIYRFEEPVMKVGENEKEVTAFDRIIFQLPDERKDTETLMLDPNTRDLYVISKREKPVAVYQLRYPQETDTTLTAKKVADINKGEIVAGTFSHHGDEILLKNIKNVFYWKTDGKELEEVFKTKPHILPYEKEPQGEAITFALDDSGYYTISEKVSGEKSFLWFHKRKTQK
jgi:hypothetical protein